MTTAFQPNAYQANAFQVDAVTGVLDVIDQNDTGSFVGQVLELPNTIDTHDGVTKQELKRIRGLQKRIKKAEEERNRLRIEAVKARKNAIADLVDPKPVVAIKEVKKVEPKLIKEVPSIDLRAINAEIRKLEKQKADLLQSIAYRQEIARIQTELAILEAKRQADEDDVEALLMLL